MQLKKISNKAQEEMVGFVMIMLIVAVIFLVFLGIIVRKERPMTDQNAELSQFLDVAVEFTTSCTTDGYHYLSLSELAAKCNLGAKCSYLSGAPLACDILKKNLKEMIESTRNFSAESVYKGYIIEINRKTSAGEEGILPPITSTSPAGCSSKVGAEKPIFTQGGTIIFSLKYCMN